MRKRLTAAAPFLAVALLAAPAHATFSVAAVDPATGHIGGAGTSCIGDYSVTVIYGSVPGRGVVHAQAALTEASRPEAVARLSMGQAPNEIIAALTDPAFDAGAAERQYGSVDLEGRVAGYTGKETIAYAAHRTGTVDGITYVLAGNILTGDPVLARMEAAFAEGCDLPDRLVRALEAGAENGEGDARCTPLGIPADSAFVRVEAPDGARVLDADFVDTAPESPLIAIRAAYDTWRASHLCPAPPARAPQPPLAEDGCQVAGGGSDAGHRWLAMPLVALAWRRRKT